MTGNDSVLQLQIGQFSHPGRKRQNNEDWLGAFQPEDPKRLAGKGSLFLVADGMGGHRGGEIASRRAVDQVIRAYVDDPAPDPATSLRRAIELANAALHAEAGGEQDQRGWGTTLVAAVVRRDELWIANVGDSRAYLLRNGKLRQLSRDHSLASAVGGAAPEGAWIGQHIITRALGRRPNVEVDVFPPLNLRARDRILLCSDGLTSPLSDREIRAIAASHPPQQAAEALVKAANEQGGPDNISVILVQVSERGAIPSWQTPSELLAALLRPETWQELVESVLTEEEFRSPVFMVVLVLFILAVIGLGCVLGLVLLK